MRSRAPTGSSTKTLPPSDGCHPIESSSCVVGPNSNILAQPDHKETGQYYCILFGGVAQTNTSCICTRPVLTVSFLRDTVESYPHPGTLDEFHTVEIPPRAVQWATSLSSCEPGRDGGRVSGMVPSR